MEEVFVIGGNHHNTLGVLRSLGYKGINSNLILVGNEKRPYTQFSRYIKRIVKVEDDSAVIDYLLKEQANVEHAVVIACSDGVSSELDLHREALKEHFSIPGADIQGRLTAIMDKESMSELGRRIGFNVPQSWLVETIQDINDVVYPCITKPILSKDGHKSDIKICHTKEDLTMIINEGSCYKYQVQKFIEKDFEYQLIGLSLNGGEELIIPGVSRCIRPCPGTNTGYLHYESLESFNAPIDLCKQFVREVGYSGLFSIEFLRDRSGVDYFMEMNFRNDGNAICVTASGINLPYIWYLANTKGGYKKELESSTFKPVYVMPEFADFKNFVINRKIPLSQWITDIIKTDKFMEYDSKDKKPFFVEFGNMMKRFIRR